MSGPTRRTPGLVLWLAAFAFTAAACTREPVATPESAPETAAAQPDAAPRPTAGPIPSVTLPPELARVLRDYEAAWSARDPAALAALFAEDGFVLPSGGPLALRAIAYAMHGSTGYIIGGYAPEAGDEDTGKFTLTLRRGDDGRWLIVSDMDNSNRPPR